MLHRLFFRRDFLFGNFLFRRLPHQCLDTAEHRLQFLRLHGTVVFAAGFLGKRLDQREIGLFGKGDAEYPDAGVGGIGRQVFPQPAGFFQILVFVTGIDDAVGYENNEFLRLFPPIVLEFIDSPLDGGGTVREQPAVIKALEAVGNAFAGLFADNGQRHGQTHILIENNHRQAGLFLKARTHAPRARQ